jgi:hypothetical protein
MRCRSSPLLAGCLLALIGCKKDEIQVYQAPKESGSVSAPAASPAIAPAEAAGPDRAPWTVPDGWKDNPSAGGMRVGSYSVSTPDGRTVDISVVPLGPEAGNTLDNVNRWRNELKLPPVAETDLPGLTSSVQIGSVASKLYDFVSTEPVIDGKYKARTLASMLSLEKVTVFFKLKGEDALALENKPKFIAWLKSVQTGAPDPAPQASASPDMRGSVPPPPPTGLPKWTPPAHWKSVAPSAMRLASFSVPGDEGSKADLSVSALGGPAGGVLENVLRWRRQLDLEPIPESDLSKSTQTLETVGGEKFTLVELAGTGGHTGTGILGAIVPRGERTWFYKLMGPAKIIATERENFQNFVKSVQYP